MRTGSQPLATALGVVATLLAMLPLNVLFRDNAWMSRAALLVVVGALVGDLLRRVTRQAMAILLAQLAATSYVLALLFLRDTLMAGLPTLETLVGAAALMEQCRETLFEHAAPAPVDDGVAFALCLIVTLVGVAVDLAVATARSASVAGLPIVALFLIAATNSPQDLPWGYFVLPAAAWLAALAAQSREDLTRWATLVPRLRSGGDAGLTTDRRMLGQAQRLGLLGLALAVALPLVIPHLPPTFLADGLGSRRGTAGGTGPVSLADDVDLRRSLGDRSPAPVIRYRTDATRPEPLRVGAVVDFEDGRARVVTEHPPLHPGFPVQTSIEPPPDGPPQERHEIEVLSNRVAAPQLPAPANLVELDLGGRPRALDTEEAVRVDGSVQQYSAEYLIVDPAAEDLPAAQGGGLLDTSRYLALDPGSAGAIQELQDEIVAEGATALEAAQQVQAYLRGTDFTYSLTLEPVTSAPGDDDPVRHFLRTKTGYCVQYATTMVLLARASGIPARMAVGFLPGTPNGRERVVRAADAHAWPELYFPGSGWLRFEPTPGGDSASVPTYSRAGGASSEEPQTTTSSSTTSEAAERPQEAEVDPGAGQEDSGWRLDGRVVRLLVAALVLLLLLGVLPLSALAARSRRAALARDDSDRVELEWERLLGRLDDLGVRAPEGATPRRTGEVLAQEAMLGERERVRLTRVVDTLERARYAPPGHVLPDIGEDADRVVEHLRRKRPRSVRARAALAPSEGVAVWRAAAAWLARLPWSARRRRQSR